MNKLSLLPILLLMLIPCALAIGLASPYLENRTLYMVPNESIIFTVKMQNPEEEVMRIDLELTENDYAYIVDKQEYYSLQPKTYDNAVDINVTVPPHAGVGVEGQFGIIMLPVSSSDGGDVPFQLKISKTIPIKIVRPPGAPEPEPEEPARIVKYLLPLVLLCIAIVIIAIRVRKK